MRRDRTSVPLDVRDPAGRDAESTGTAVVGRVEAAAALLDPVRRRVLAALQAPGSASSIASAMGLSRQRVNYHVRALQRAGLLEEVGSRKRRGLTERLVRATAAHYLISPAAIGTLGDTPTGALDRFSATYQVAVAARTIREVAELSALARRAGKRLTTMTLDAEVRFATPSAREQFANELVSLVSELVARHDAPASVGGRAYRIFAGAHPAVPSRDSSADGRWT